MESTTQVGSRELQEVKSLHNHVIIQMLLKSLNIQQQGISVYRSNIAEESIQFVILCNVMTKPKT